MTMDDRLHRPAPARDSPRRGFHPSVGSPDPRAGPTASPKTADEIIAGAVSAAYRVVEENVLDGRRAAERLRAGAAVTPETAENAKAIANRLIGLARDLGATWIDLIGAVFREPELRALLERVTSPSVRGRPEPGAGGAAGTTPSATTPIAQRISSRKPLEIRLSALDGIAADAPAVAGLHSLAPGAPPIAGVSFQQRPGGGLELRIDVADDQPVGVYVGAVVGLASQEPMGTLSVRVLE